MQHVMSYQLIHATGILVLSRSNQWKVINLVIRLLTVLGAIYMPGHMGAVLTMRMYGV
jgi:hypothetical protein